MGLLGSRHVCFGLPAFRVYLYIQYTVLVVGVVRLDEGVCHGDVLILFFRYVKDGLEETSQYVGVPLIAEYELEDQIQFYGQQL